MAGPAYLPSFTSRESKSGVKVIGVRNAVRDRLSV